MNYMVKMTAQLESNLVSVERINEYCHTPCEVSREIKMSNKKKRQFFWCCMKADWVIEKHRPPKDWPSQGNIKFKNYSVKYRDELDYVLKSINTDIKPGEKVSY